MTVNAKIQNLTTRRWHDKIKTLKTLLLSKEVTLRALALKGWPIIYLSCNLAARQVQIRIINQKKQQRLSLECDQFIR